MRKIKEVLRLKYGCGLSERDIAVSCSVTRGTVGNYLRRAVAAGLKWPLEEELSDTELERRLFPVITTPSAKRPRPDCEDIHNQLRDYKRVNLTLMQLWLEYRKDRPDAYQYTQFCEYYHRWRGKLGYSMRQVHRAGEKVFVDYGGSPVLVDQETGELIPAQLFVAVWGASNYTYAEASLTQSLPDWTGSHARAFAYFGCVPRMVVPDNLKSGVNKASYYDPEINPTYADLADHYGCAVLPTRPRRPRDKAKVEAGVLVAQRWILAVLRHRTFFGLDALNAAIRELLEDLNTRLMRRVGKSRRELFETLDRPAALPLPAQPYEYAEWRKATVNIDYHIEVDGHYYSVPFSLIREKLEVRLTATTLEVLRRNERVAAHPRSYILGGHTTLKEHMPPDHRRYAEWSPSRFLQWAGKTGEATAQVVGRILASRTYPEQSYRACLGILRLSRQYDPSRVEAAARRALEFNTCSYRSLRSILAAGLDAQAPQEKRPASLPLHANVRGPEFYN
jgi:transposase